MSIVIKRTRIIGTDQIVFTAWEPSPGITRGGHSTVTMIDGKSYGKIGTDPDRTLYYHLAEGSKERIAAVALAYDQRREVAYAAILAAHPEAADGARRSFGEIIINEGNKR